MSTQNQQRAAILRDMADLGLDPKVAHSKIRASGRLAVPIAKKIAQVVLVEEAKLPLPAPLPVIIEEPLMIEEIKEETCLRSGLVSIAEKTQPIIEAKTQEELAPVVSVQDADPIDLQFFTAVDMTEEKSIEEVLVKKVRQHKKPPKKKKNVDES